MTTSKAIALWSHPRSMSTSVERCFRERGDCTCHHEPFMYFYYLVKAGNAYPGFDPDDDRPRNLNEISAMLMPGSGGPETIFFKDMSYYVVDNLDLLAPFMREVISIFLIRDPRFSLASYARLDPGFSLQEAGLEAQWRHYSWLRSRDIPAMVIEAETISQQPAASIRAMCDFAGLAHRPAALSWTAQQVPDDWQQAIVWHAGSIASTGFAPADQRDPDMVFAKARQQLPHLEDYLYHHLPYYEKLKAVAVHI